MEVNQLNLTEESSLRWVELNSNKWFCVNDICDILGTKTNCSQAAKSISDEEKQLIKIKSIIDDDKEEEKELLFVIEDAAHLIITNSRKKNNQDMKKLLFEHIKSKPKKERSKTRKQGNNGSNRLVGDVLTAGEIDEFVDIENKQIENKMKKIPNKPVDVSPVGKKDKEIIPSSKIDFSSAFQQSPELVKSYIELEKFRIEKEIELQKKKEELEANVRAKKIEAEMARDNTNRKLEFMNQSQTFLKLALKHATFEDRQKLSPLLQEYAKASQSILWENFDMEFKKDK